jgi:hypothetical protein
MCRPLTDVMSREKKSAPDQDKPQLQLAEVITASITTLIAETGNQIYQNQHHHQHGQKTDAALRKPRFGSFIRIDSPENGLALFAVVFDVITNPPDSVHKPSALGLTREKLRQEQPHIFALLKTQVHAQIIGFRESAPNYDNDESAIIYQHLPPQPPEVHDFVYAATQKETIRLTSNFEFLRLLSQVSSPPADELIAAAVREAAQAREGEARERYLIEAGRAITQLFRSDYEHMLSIVRKIKPQQSIDQLS